MSTATPTLFVQIAAYRDPDLPATIHNLLSRAAHPERVHIGICLQLGSGDPDTWGSAGLPSHPHLRLNSIPAEASRGACWARHQAQQLYRDELFLLQIDSHMRAVPQWDLKLLRMWQSCRDARAVLSVYPNGFEQPCRLNMTTLPVMAARAFDHHGILQFQGISRYVMPDEQPAAPLPNAFVAGGFLFAPACVVRNVPYDPELYFYGEEISLSARLWTHGYNIYTPNDLVLFHLYKTSSAEELHNTHWNDHHDWFESNRRSVVRVHTLLNSMQAAPQSLRPLSADLQTLENYGLGTERSLEDYQRWSGVNFSRQSIDTNALAGRFPAGRAG